MLEWKLDETKQFEMTSLGAEEVARQVERNDQNSRIPTAAD